MSEGLVVRRVTDGDFEAVTALLEELGRPRVTAATAGAARAIFAAHVSSPDAGSLLAERDNIPVGFLSLHFRDRLNHATPEAWIPDLVVTEREHGSGAGSALLRRAVDLARERGCHRLVLESGYNRLRAHRFYTREGMTDAGKYFVVELVSTEY